VKYMSNTHRSLAGKTAVFDSSAPKSDEPQGVESGHKSRDGRGRDLLYIGLMAKGWTFQSLIDAMMEVTEFCHHAPRKGALDDFSRGSEDRSCYNSLWPSE
jgi:hypothetical protein